MKLQNILTALLLVSTGVFAYLYFTSDPRETDTTKSSPDCVGTCWVNDGEELKDSDTLKAKKRIQAYEKLLDSTDAAGFHVGLKTLEAMIEQAHQYNQGICEMSNVDTNKVVTGYRFYKAFAPSSSMKYCDLTMALEDSIVDMIAVPVTRNGRDIYALYDSNKPFLPGLSMYNHFRPCPKACGRSRLKQWNELSEKN